MVRTQIYLSEQQRKRIAERAKSEGKSQAGVIREILDETLGIDDRTVEERLAILRRARGIWKDRDDIDEYVAQTRRNLLNRAKRLGLE